MISKKELIELYTDGNTPYWRICEYRDSTLLGINETESEKSASLDKLNFTLDKLKSYGRVTIKFKGIGAKSNEESQRFNWKSGLSYDVMLVENDKVESNSTLSGTPGGYVSREIMETQLANVRSEVKLENQIAELKRELQSGTNEDKYMKYVDIIFDRLNINPTNKSIDGAAGYVIKDWDTWYAKNEKMFKEELEKINPNINTLVEKVDIRAINKLLSELIENPGLVKKAMDRLK